MAGVAKKWPAPNQELPALDAPGLRLPDRKDSTEAVSSSNSEAILSDLRALVAAAPRDTDRILGAIARVAQSLTSASGAAVAMRRGGVVICLGSSGETAPALGTRLGVDSGISGECLRTGETLRCDDTNTDSRVDPEVCKRFGLRSIAVVPLHEQGETVGIVEAFSTRPYSFTDGHIQSLVRLAKLAETSAAPAERAAPDAQTLSPLRANARKTEIAPHLARWQRYRIAVVVGIMLLLLSVLAWRMPHNLAKEVPGNHQLPAARIVRPAPAATSEQIDLSNLNNDISTRRGMRHTAETGAADSVTRYRVAPNVHDRSSTPPEASPVEALPAPKIAASATNTDEIRTLLSVPATLPNLTRSVSAFSGGVLVHRVPPVYPPQALKMRVAGTVVMQATIAENGSVRDLKVKSGHPALAQAAFEAVRHWRYNPFLMNGRPFQKEVDISINFKLPD
jgi:TonB family protein